MPFYQNASDPRNPLQNLDPLLFFLTHAKSLCTRATHAIIPTHATYAILLIHTKIL